MGIIIPVSVFLVRRGTETQTSFWIVKHMVDIAITNRNRNVHNLAINDTAIGLFILMQRDYVTQLIQIYPVLMVSPTVVGQSGPFSIYDRARSKTIREEAACVSYLLIGEDPAQLYIENGPWCISILNIVPCFCNQGLSGSAFMLGPAVSAVSTSCEFHPGSVA